MDRKLRLKIIKKLAQTATTTTTPTTSGNTAPVAPAPLLDIWSAYPDLMKAYNEHQIQILNGLVHRLSTIANQMTAGKYNFQTLRNASFQFDPSEFSDPNTKNLMLFFLKVFKSLLNSGNAFATNPINPTQLGAMVNNLMQATELNSLSQVNPTGPVANQQAGNNDLPQTIRNNLQALQPNVVARPS